MIIIIYAEQLLYPPGIFPYIGMIISNSEILEKKKIFEK